MAESARDIGFEAVGAGLGGALVLEDEVALPFEIAGGLKGRFVAAVAPTCEGCRYGGGMVWLILQVEN